MLEFLGLIVVMALGYFLTEVLPNWLNPWSRNTPRHVTRALEESVGIINPNKKV